MPKHERRAGSGSVAIYTRVSSDRQEEGVSLDQQEAACRAFCESRGWQIGQVFSDTQSGRTTEREELQNLLAQLDNFEAFVCWRLDRATRSVVDCWGLLEACEDAGAEFVSVTEALDTSTPMGKAMTSIVATFAALESDNISARVRAVKGHQLDNGQIPWKAKYGYRRNAKGRAEVDPEEAQVVKRVFQERLTERKLKDIIADLHADGLLRRGLPWTWNKLSALLHDTTYIGQYVRGTKRHDGTQCVRLPREEWDVVEGLYPTIIDTATWENVHGMSLRGRRPAAPALFRGMLVCDCGSSIYTHSRRKKKGEGFFVDYRCAERQRGSDCTEKQHTERRVVEFVTEALEAIAAGEATLLVEARQGWEAQAVAVERRRQFALAQEAYVAGVLDLETLTAAKAEHVAAEETLGREGPRPGTPSEKVAAATIIERAFGQAEAGDITAANHSLRQGFTRFYISADRAELVGSVAELQEQFA